MSLPKELNPLTGAHYDQVHEGLRALNNARHLIAAAQAAGLDTAAHSHMCDHLEKQLHGIKTAFFAGGRPQP